MKRLMILSTFLIASISAPSWAAEMTNGLIKKVDEKLMKVTIKHEDLKNLSMPAMTMVFAVKDADMLKKLKEGAKIKFVADRIDGKLTVVEVQ